MTDPDDKVAELVAEAICLHTFGDNPGRHLWDNASRGFKRAYMDRARAATKVMKLHMTSMRTSPFLHWAWETGSPQERGTMVRKHVTPLKADVHALSDLFLLTDDGVRKIMDGDDWRPEYDRHAFVSGNLG